MDSSGLPTNLNGTASTPLSASAVLPCDSSSSMGYTVNAQPQTMAQFNQPAPDITFAENVSLGQHVVTPHQTGHGYISTSDQSMELSPGVSRARLQREIYLAVNHIQSHVDKHYPGKFMFTISDDNALKVTSDFVAPFGWWQGACFRVNFDFSWTDKNNAGPVINFVLAPPFSHLFDGNVCLAQAMPYSEFSFYWRERTGARYGSYNFDRVQQMMNVINFAIMDTDFFEEGIGEVFCPDPRRSIDYLEDKERKLDGSSSAYVRKSIIEHESIVKESASYDGLIENVAAEICRVNKKAMKLGISLCFEHEDHRIAQLTKENMSFSKVKPVDYKGIKYYSHSSLSECIYVSPIVVEPDGEWQKYMSGKNHIDIPVQQKDQKITHRADYFFPVHLDPQGIVAEFLVKEVEGRPIDRMVGVKKSKKLFSLMPSATFSNNQAENVDIVPYISNKPDEGRHCYSLWELKRTLKTALSEHLTLDFTLGSVKFGNESVITDKELTKLIDKTKDNIKRNNKHRKKTNKMACVFVRSPENRPHSNSRVWSANIKPTKTIAKASNLASQFALTISPETPVRTQRYRDGMQWGIPANAWLPVMDREMAEYEKLATIKFLVDFAHKALKLPNKREAITAHDANNIIMKSMTMTMVMALEEGDKWLPSQCFLDLIVNAINTQYEIGRFYADMKYHNLKMMFNCFSGKLDRNNLKDFAFLINYVVASLAQQEQLNDVEKSYLIPVVMINSFVEYLVRVMERESRKSNKDMDSELDNEQSLTLDKIIKASKTGFSVVAHQLTILHFLSFRAAPLTKLEEFERDQLQSRVKAVQQLVSTDTDNYYGQLFNLMLPASRYWTQPADFDSPDHQKMILQTTLDKFHQRTRQLPHQSFDDSSQLSMDVDDSTVPDQTFAVSGGEEYEKLLASLSGQLEKLKLRKNFQVVEGGIKKYLHSCHYCGDQYVTSKPLYETKNQTKLKRIKRGFIYRSGKPMHWDCKAQRKSDTERALKLISAIEENSYPFPQSLARNIKKNEREAFNATWNTTLGDDECALDS